jgi:hypothetical protein
MATKCKCKSRSGRVRNYFASWIPDSDWIRIVRNIWIRTQIAIYISDPDPRIGSGFDQVNGPESSVVDPESDPDLVGSETF